MTLHVTNGDSVSLRQTSLGGDVLVWRDVLHDQGAEPPALRGDVVLWFEHDLYDQLQLIDALRRAESVPELIVVDRYLGELQPDELEALWPTRQKATPEQIEEARRAWTAFTAPDPIALAEWEGGHLPFLAAAFRRLLEEFPSVEDGLSGTERRALEAIDGGRRTPREAFVAYQQLEDAKFLGDTWFFRTLEEIAPLIGMEPGEVDRVELLGIDRWVGGTHVTPGTLWRRDGNRILLT